MCQVASNSEFSNSNQKGGDKSKTNPAGSEGVTARFDAAQ